MFEMIKNPNIHFINFRKIAYVISAVLILAGFYAFFAMATGKAKMGLDFTGGSTVQVKFSKPVTVEKIREIMEKNGLGKAVIQQIGESGNNEYMIRLASGMVKTGEASIIVSQLLAKEVTGEGAFTIEGSSDIGPVVSAQLKQNALYAVFFATLGILTYIWIRFKFRFAVAATVATAHDVFAILGIMVLTGREIDLLVITAILTLAGYSLTDTVVVFDRIRENMRLILKMPFEEMVNKSINEVLSRSIITATTTLLTAVALFFFGGEVLHNFSFALILGILVGTYSSIFVAAPLVVDWELFDRKNKASGGK